MGLVNGFAIVIYMILIYLLSKIIIDKNAQSISMTKILGYTNGEISRLYIMSTMVVVVIELLLSLPIETVVMNVIFRVMMMEVDRMDHTVDLSKDICGNVPDRIHYLWCGSTSNTARLIKFRWMKH